MRPSGWCDEIEEGGQAFSSFGRAFFLRVESLKMVAVVCYARWPRVVYFLGRFFPAVAVFVFALAPSV